MMAYLSARAASLGKCSLIEMPGTEVAIGLNSPRISAGASGLGSQVSSCEGPPHIKIKMHCLARPNPRGLSAVDADSCGLLDADSEAAIRLAQSPDRPNPRLPSQPASRAWRRFIRQKLRR